jgi:hypothetical protein
LMSEGLPAQANKEKGHRGVQSEIISCIHMSSHAPTLENESRGREEGRSSRFVTQSQKGWTRPRANLRARAHGCMPVPQRMDVSCTGGSGPLTWHRCPRPSRGAGRRLRREEETSLPRQWLHARCKPISREPRFSPLHRNLSQEIPVRQKDPSAARKSSCQPPVPQ